MGVSEVLLCPYRCLEYKMERLEKLKIQLCFYNASISSTFRDIGLLMYLGHDLDLSGRATWPFDAQVPIFYRRSICYQVTMTSRDLEWSTSWPQYVWRLLSRKFLEIEIRWQANISKSAGDRGTVPKGSPTCIGNVLWRVEWLARWRHVSGLLIRNWLHIVTPLSESIKLFGIIEKQQI